jgi:hypothetical protein
MDVFWSMWSCRTVACPWGSGAPACETTLLHHEQFKIPEHLARFAVRHGMWSFVKCMADHVPLFVAQRRQRCAPGGQDPRAYGAGCAPNPPSAGGGARGGGASASCSSPSLLSVGSSVPEGSVCSRDSLASGGSGGSARRLARVAAVLLAGGVAMALQGGAGGHRRAQHARAHPHHVRRHRRPSLVVPEE